MRKFLKRTGIIILIIIAGLCTVIELKQDKKFLAPCFNIKTKMTMPQLQSEKIQYLAQLIASISL